MTGTQTIQISEATYQALMEETKVRGLSLEELLRAFLPVNDTEESGETIGERLRRKQLVGTIDSSLPDDPASPPHRPPLYYLIAEKFRKQGLKLP